MSDHTVYLGIGSNIDPEHHIPAGLERLKRLFGRVPTSSIYLSPALGFDGPPFLNLVVRISTRLSLGDLAETLRDIEYRHGRSPESRKYSSRRLDLDLLTYGRLRGRFGDIVLPRGEIFDNAHVLCPFAELAPRLVLPGVAQTLKTLWESYDNPEQPLTRVAPAFRWAVTV